MKYKLYEIQADSYYMVDLPYNLYLILKWPILKDTFVKDIIYNTLQMKYKLYEIQADSYIDFNSSYISNKRP